MLHGLAGTLSLQVGCFQLEVPLGGAIGIINQHEAGIMSQSDGLLLHGAPVLVDELARKDPEEGDHEGYPAEDVPGGAEVDTALFGCKRRHGGAT